jgi:outer membrane lipoprotein SlyB
MLPRAHTYLPPRFKTFIARSPWSLVTLSAVLLATSGCNTAPSRTTTGAGTGAATGAVIGGVAGNSGTAVLGGAAAGAVVGGLIGAAQDARERRDQERLSQERAYQQELARRRAEEARMRAEMEEEVAVAQGFRISDIELREAQGRLDNAAGRLARLQAERDAALARKRALDEAQQRLLDTEAEIARLEEELARLRDGEITPPAGGNRPDPIDDFPPSP